MTRTPPFSAAPLIRLAPYALITAGLALRLNALGFQSLWRDEVDAIRFALAPLPDLIQTFSQPGFNGPLYFLLLRGWIGAAGQSEYALRFLSLIFGVVGIALIYVLGRRLFNRPIGLVAALLLTVSAYHVWYSQEVKMYTLITALALAALYSLRRAVEAGRARWWAGVIVCTSLAMYSHILAALLIPVEVVLFIVWWPLSRSRLKPGLITLAALTLPYLPLAVWQLPLIFQPAETGFGHFTFGDMAYILGIAYTRGILNSLPVAVVNLAGALAAALAAFGLLAYARPTAGRHITTSLSLLVWIAGPLLAIFIVSINRPLFTDRYLIWIMPAYYLLIACGVVALWPLADNLPRSPAARSARPRRSIFATGLAAAAVISVMFLAAVNTAGIQTQAITPFKADFRSAARFIEAARQPDEPIVFQIPYIQYTFDYYFKQPYQPIAGPFTEYRNAQGGYRDSEAAVFQQLDAVFANRRSVWLVASEVAMWDGRDLLRRWLDAHGTRTQYARFPQVEVSRYELK